MTMTFELDLFSDKVNQHAKYLGQESFHSKAIVRMHTHTHTTHTHTGRYCFTWTTSTGR